MLRRAAGIYATALLLSWASCASGQPDKGGFTSGTADEAPVVEDWRAICLAHRDDFERTERMAADSGWTLAPEAVVPPLASAVGKPRAWLRRSAGRVEFLATGG